MKQAEECISRKVVPTENKEEHTQQNVSTKPEPGSQAGNPS